MIPQTRIHAEAVPSAEALSPVASSSSIVQHEPTPVDESDRRQLVLDHLWLADTIARRYTGRGEDADDLRQVARCALVEATTRYDPQLGPFVSYAAPTISGVVKRHFRDHAWVVRPPRRVQLLSLQMINEWSDVAQEVHREPTAGDFATSLGEPLAEVVQALRASLTYQASPIETDGSPIPAIAIDDPAFDDCEAGLLIAQVWSRLEPAERSLLRMRFWENRSQTVIAQQIGTSQMQVSRLLTRTLRRLRNLLEEAPAA